MKIAIELFCVWSLTVNLTFTVLGLFPSLARHPVKFVRALSQLSLISLYQMQGTLFTRTWWYNLMHVSILILWAGFCGAAFAHGWTFVGVALAYGLIYSLFSEAMIAFKPLNQYCY